MPGQLQIYNGALRILGERRLASLTTTSESRRLLDDAWGDGLTQGSVKLCLEMGQWSWATRTVLIDYSPSVEPPFGYRYAFDQPADLVRTVGVYQDEFCKTPLLEYATERRYWYTETESIYVQYVSNHTSYGGDPSLWSEIFVNMVQAALAVEIAPNLTESATKTQMAQKAWEQAMKLAKSLDAMEKPTKFLPEGSWVRARRGAWRNSMTDRC
jgi:hypothetical protein